MNALFPDPGRADNGQCIPRLDIKSDQRLLFTFPVSPEQYRNLPDGFLIHQEMI
jgi:hypothetical protein